MRERKRISLIAASALVLAALAPAPSWAVTDLGPEGLDAPISEAPRLDVEGQRRGEFGSLGAREEVPGGAIQGAWERAEPGDAVFQHKWRATSEGRMRLREGMASTIALPDWERIQDFALADQFNFAARPVKDSSNLLWVWVQNPGYDTNINIVGESGNIYAVYLRGETWNSQNVPDLVFYVQASRPSWAPESEPETIPADGAPAAVTVAASADDLAEGAPEWLRHVKFDPAKVRHDRRMKGDSEIAPVLVFRDEHFTYLDYGESLTDWPAVYMVKDGVDVPVRVRKSPDGRFLVAETTLPLTLRLGEKTVCVLPESS